MRIVLWSLLLGGVNIYVGGRTPLLLYFDFIFALWLIYEIAWNGYWPNTGGWIVRLGVFCLMLQTLSAIVNYRDIYKSLASMKILAVGLLVYIAAKRFAPSVFTLSAWGAAAGFLLLVSYLRASVDAYEGISGIKDVIQISLGRSNYVASILLLLIPLSIAGVALYKGKCRIACAGCAIAMLAGLVVTMSRGAMSALVLASLLSSILLWRAGFRWKQWFAVVAVVALVLLVLPIELLETNAALIAFRWENPDLSRQELMAASWDAFMDNPILGVGPGQLGRAIASAVPAPDENQQYVNAHNLVLNALAENGLPAGIALLAMVYLVLRVAWKAARSSTNMLSVALWIGLLAAVLHNLVEASFEGQQFQVIFWTVAAMSERLNHKYPTPRNLPSTSPLPP